MISLCATKATSNYFCIGSKPVVCCSIGDSRSTTMAFAHGSTQYPCQICGQPHTWMKLFASENPATHGFRDMGPQTQSTAAENLELGQSPGRTTQKVKRRVCIECEISWRVDAQEWHNRVVGREDPNWSSSSAVVATMKHKHKGEFRNKQAAHWNAACAIVQSLPDYNKMSKRQRGGSKNTCLYALCGSFPPMHWHWKTLRDVRQGR